MNTSDTIIAPATPPGEGGIAIIRISGKYALEYLIKFFRPSSKIKSFSSHLLYHGLLVDKQHQIIDEVMAVFMAAPKTYTREDVVEIHSHGSQQIVKTIIQIFINDGLRLASPGEFTYRAYINGRLDLSQAEAVSSLIKSNSDTSRRLALSQVGGQLSQIIYSFNSRIKHTLVLSEAWIDFPEENLPEEDYLFLQKTIKDILNQIINITESFDYGRIQIEGASILIVGEPNVGKSSLLNQFLGEERAIVTDVAGTTRDTLEEGLFIDGLPVRVIDSAGIRLTDDRVEQEGIYRAVEKIKFADLVLLIVDAGHGFIDFNSQVFLLCLDCPTFLVINKDDIKTKDIDTSRSPFPVFYVSAKTGKGLDVLKKSISTFLCGNQLTSFESVMLTEKRHYEVLLKAKENLVNSLALIGDGGDLDLLSFELRQVLFYLGQISGETTTEDVLDDIFSGFCIGK